jgi:Fe-S oxidoreductase
VHDVVSREPYAARMHMLAAGGILAAIALSLPLHWLGLGGWPLALLALLSLLAAAIGIGMAGARRRAGTRARRLSGGSYQALPWALALSAGFLALSAVLAGSGGPAWAWFVAAPMGALGLGWLVHAAYGGPMRHALAGASHLVVHPRPARLSGVRDTALRPLDLDNAQEPLGAGRMADFAFNRLVSYDACVQCGKCEEACPAFAAGQPLNPKALINAFVRASGPGIGAPYAGSPHPGLPAGTATAANAHVPLLDDGSGTGFVDPATLWACTTCRACVEACPMLIEHVDAVIDLRRFVTLETGDVPDRVAAALTELRETDTMAGRALDSRLDWAVDLKLPLMAETGGAEVLLWIGEAGFERRNQRTLRSLIRLLRAAGVDFAVLGAEERDCGDTARRLGDEAGFQRLAAQNIATLRKYRFETILTADPHVLHALSREYRVLGADFRVQHHTTFLDRLLSDGRLALADFAGDKRRITFHDPCYLGRYSGEVEAPRRLIDRLGVERVEMARSGLNSSCCGGGGGAPLADVAGKRRIPDIRMDHARETGAEVVAVGCPNCMLMLEGVVGPRPEVVDVAELLAARLEAAP